MTRDHRDQGGTDDLRRLSVERLFVKRETIIQENILDRSEASCGRREPDPQDIFQEKASRT